MNTITTRPAKTKSNAKAPRSQEKRQHRAVLLGVLASWRSSALPRLAAACAVALLSVLGCDRNQQPIVEDDGDAPQAATPADPASPAAPGAGTGGMGGMDMSQMGDGPLPGQGAPAEQTGAAVTETTWSSDVISWTIPQGWTHAAGQGVRYAVITTPAGEVVVTHFGGDVGGLHANVNRWRAQIGLPPIEADQLEQVATPVDGAAAPVTLVDLPAAAEGQPGMLVGVVSAPAETWFFKLVGQPEALAATKDVFRTFLTTIQTGPATP